MAVERPTFSESWYRVAAMRPRLRSTVETYRQGYRGQTWHILRDPASNSFFRLDDAGYFLLCLLDGRRPVADAWAICNENLGDAAPTQGEVIELLGQLYSSNLLSAELAPDTATMFERYRKRRRREVGGYMMNLLFARIPLVDPNWLLDKWVGVVRWVFTWWGFVLWAILIGAALYVLTGRFDELLAGADPQTMLRPENIALLYLAFAGTKAVHELGHGFACKHFGQQSNSGGEVHTLGIMLLIFMPMPYVDASSAWAFRNKWHRIVVSCAGMYCELAVAAVAALLWASLGQDSGVVGALLYNIIIIASISTILFNANPLLRYDGYYILADLLEIPNLQQRSKQYLYHLVKKYLYGVRRDVSPIRSPGEKGWMAFYAVASTVYRVFISVAILLYVANAFFFVGMILAMTAIAGWVIKPIGKWVHYLATSPQLARTRGRAIGVTLASFAICFALIGAVNFPDRKVVLGIAEPTVKREVYVSSEGFLVDAQPSGASVSPTDEPIAVLENNEMVVRREQLSAQRQIESARHRAVLRDEPAAAQVLGSRIAALDKRIERSTEQIAKLRVSAPVEGTWLPADLDQMRGAFLKRGEPLGAVVNTREVVIRVPADQRVGPRIIDEVGLGGKVEIRVQGRPEFETTGTIIAIHATGQRKLPSAALGMPAGGDLAIDMQDPEGMQTAQQYIPVIIQPDNVENLPLLMQQRVMVRFETPPKPLAVQWWRVIRQLTQERFSI